MVTKPRQRVRKTRKIWSNHLNPSRISTHGGVGFTMDELEKKRYFGRVNSTRVGFLPQATQDAQDGDILDFDYGLNDIDCGGGRADYWLGGEGTNTERRLREARELEENLPRFARVLGSLSPDPDCSCPPKDIRPSIFHCIGLKESGFRSLPSCACNSSRTRMILEGYFPTAPVRTRTAFSLELLRFFRLQHHHAKPTKDGFVIALSHFHRAELRQNLLPTDYKEAFRKTIPFYFRALQLGASMRTDAIVSAGLASRDVIDDETLAGRCPADFYRDDDEKYNSPWIIGIDGNFQHWRHKNASKNDVPAFASPIIVHVPEMDRATSKPTTETGDEDNTTGLCSHNFKAAGSKPPSMEKCDETGLFAVICRHDVPLLLMNAYSGERFEFIVKLIKAFLEVVERETGLKNKLLLTYDVACRLKPHLEAHHKDISSEVDVVVNKFHGYAHELRCQLVYGANWKQFLAETDGEGPERVWAALKWLVASGRESGPGGRLLFLIDRCEMIAREKRYHLIMTLMLRFVKAKKNFAKHEKLLADTIGEEVVFKRAGSDTPEIVTITKELLKEEAEKQWKYFATSTSRKIKAHESIFKSFSQELLIKQKRKMILQDFKDGLISYARRNTRLRQVGELSIQSAKTDLLLARHKQTRGQWNMTGPLWKEALRRNPPQLKIYKCLLEERQAEVDQTRNQTLPLNEYERKMRELRKATEEAMASQGFQRDSEEWKEDGLLFVRYTVQETVIQLEDLYGEILAVSAMRALELRNFKARTRGHKEGKSIFRKLVSRYPALEGKIDRFNELSQTLPERYRPTLLTKDAFKDQDSTLNELPDVDGAEALWFLEVLRSDLLDVGRNVPDGCWPYSAKIRAGIDSMNRRDRAEEEYVFAEFEFDRYVLYTLRRLRSLMSCLQNPPPGYTERRVFLDLIWEELKQIDIARRARTLFRKKRIVSPELQVGDRVACAFYWCSTPPLLSCADDCKQLLIAEGYEFDVGSKVAEVSGKVADPAEIDQVDLDAAMQAIRDDHVNEEEDVKLDHDEEVLEEMLGQLDLVET